MEIPERTEANASSISHDAGPRRRRTRRAFFLLSVGIVSLTAIGAGTSSLDRDQRAGARSDKRLAVAFPAGRDDAAPLRVTSLSSSETSYDANAENTFQDRLRGLGLAVSHAVVPPASAPSGGLLGTGDRLKITFYERVESEDDKWGRPTSALKGIQQRPELSGEYAVQEDGTISVPLLGVVPATGRAERDVQATLMEMFEASFGRKAMVNVQLQERAPVYVLGPVRNPGSFKYVPGMTVLHVLALAGGLDHDRGSNDPWQKIEATRTIQKRDAAVDSTLKLLARSAVLRAERDGSTPKVPAKLLKLVGVAEAESLVDEQEDRRKAIAIARRERERAAQSAVDSAKQDLRMYARTDSLDELIKTRQERVESIRGLVEKNIAPKAQLSQVQAELSDAEQRRLDAFNQYSQAKQRLAQLENDALRARADLTNDLSVEIDTVERQITDNERELDVSDHVLGALPATRALFSDEKSKGDDRLRYVIVRQTPSGPIQIETQGMTMLRPGDLVNVVTERAEARSQDRSNPGTTMPAPAPTTQPATHPTLINRAAREAIGSDSKRD